MKYHLVGTNELSDNVPNWIGIASSVEKVHELIEKTYGVSAMLYRFIPHELYDLYTLQVGENYRNRFEIIVEHIEFVG